MFPSIFHFFVIASYHFISKPSNETISDLSSPFEPLYAISMGKEIKVTEEVNGRLFYYFPLNANNENNDDGLAQDQVNEHGNNTTDKEDSWIGWHNDSGEKSFCDSTVQIVLDATLIGDLLLWDISDHNAAPNGSVFSLL